MGHAEPPKFHTWGFGKPFHAIVTNFAHPIQSLRSVALSAYIPTLFDTWHVKHQHGEQGDPGEFILYAAAGTEFLL